MLQSGSSSNTTSEGATMKEKYLLFIVVMILVTILFFWIANTNLKKNSTEIERYDKNIKTTLEKLNSAMLMDAQLSQFKEILDNSLTTSDRFSIDELNDFQREIERLRENNKMKLIRISDTNKYNQPGLLEHTYNIELEGTFQQMGKFISDLEAQNYIIKIQYLDVSPTQVSGKTDPNAPNTYKITMELSIYKVKKEA
jgi:Tfp pilus assembly protein PilO